jgi:uncharacterized membrane protein YfcA
MVRMVLAVSVILALLIGLSLGAVGGGGSILAVPVLIGVTGMTVTQATSSSLVVVRTASVVGMAAHLTAERVRVGAGLLFGLAGVGGALLGTRLNERLGGDTLLIGFSALMLVVAARMAANLRRPGSAVTEDVPAGPGRPDPEPVPRPVGVASFKDGATLRRYVSATTAPPAEDEVEPPARSEHTPATRAALVLATGTGVGFLTGLFGVGGGFVIVPALMLVLGFSMAQATGTSLLVIAVNSLVALILRGGPGTIDWSVIGPFTAAAVAGVLVGRRVADRVPARTLTIALTALIVVVALWTGARGVAALT